MALLVLYFAPDTLRVPANFDAVSERLLVRRPCWSMVTQKCRSAPQKEAQALCFQPCPLVLPLLGFYMGFIHISSSTTWRTALNHEALAKGLLGCPTLGKPVSNPVLRSGPVWACI